MNRLALKKKDVLETKDKLNTLTTCERRGNTNSFFFLNGMKTSLTYVKNQPHYYGTQEDSQ